MRELSSRMSLRNLSSDLFPPFQSYDMNVVALETRREVVDLLHRLCYSAFPAELLFAYAGKSRHHYTSPILVNVRPCISPSIFTAPFECHLRHSLSLAVKSG